MAESGITAFEKADRKSRPERLEVKRHQTAD
jgi:hypothetical protein